MIVPVDAMQTAGTHGASAREWLSVRRLTGRVLLHSREPVWIVRYGSIDGPRFKFFKAFECCARVPAGREPWSIDNRSIGPKDGYRTFRAALDAANARIAEVYETPKMSPLAVQKQQNVNPERA